ncbi:MAG: hypothetical protein ABW221_07530 [Vicinamibacteria bacterium]
MGTGAKIAVGCGIALVVAVLGVVGVVVVGAYWAKSKVESVQAEQKQIEDLKTKANEASFTEPADGVVEEPQIVRFIAVRKHVHDVYSKNEAFIESMKDEKKKDANFSDVRKAFALLNELRLAQARGQADQRMSDSEYAFLVGQVYKSSWAAHVADQTGGKTVTEATDDANRKAIEQMKQAAERAAEQSPEMKETLEKQVGALEEHADEAHQAAAAADVPPQNVALFRKYEPDLKKYAMSGLEGNGL